MSAFSPTEVREFIIPAPTVVTTREFTFTGVNLFSLDVNYPVGVNALRVFHVGERVAPSLVNELSSSSFSLAIDNLVLGDKVVVDLVVDTSLFEVTEQKVVGSVQNTTLLASSIDTGNEWIYPAGLFGSYFLQVSVVTGDSLSEVSPACYEVSEVSGEVVIQKDFILAADASFNFRILRITSSGAGTGDMLKAVYDPNDDGKIDIAQLAGAEPAFSTGTTAQFLRGDKTWQVVNAASLGFANKSTIDKITEAAGLPLWDGSAWPGGGSGGGDMYKSVYDTNDDGKVDSAEVADYATTAGSATPTAHAASHASGGTDAITIAQSQVTDLTTDLAGKQASLVSGTNIKTINGESVLGSGNIVVSGSGSGSSGTIPILDWIGTETNISTRAVTGLGCAQLSASKFIVFFMSSGYLGAVIANLNTTTGEVTCTAEQVIDAAFYGFREATTCVALTSSLAVLTYRNASSYSVALAVSIDGSDVITAGAATSALFSYTQGQPARIVRVSDTQAAIATANSTNSLFLIRMANVSGTTITLGPTSSVTTTVNQESTMGLARISDTLLAAGWLQDSATVAVKTISISGSTFTQNTIVTQTTSSSPYFALSGCVFVKSNLIHLVGFYDAHGFIARFTTATTPVLYDHTNSIFVSEGSASRLWQYRPSFYGDGLSVTISTNIQPGVPDYALKTDNYLVKGGVLSKTLQTGGVAIAHPNCAIISPCCTNEWAVLAFRRGTDQFKIMALKERLI